jgi:hypothetical protein
MITIYLGSQNKGEGCQQKNWGGFFCDACRLFCFRATLDSRIDLIIGTSHNLDLITKHLKKQFIFEVDPLPRKRGYFLF